MSRACHSAIKRASNAQCLDLSAILGLVGLSLFALFITACRSPEIDLSFETIEAGEIARFGQQLYEDSNPGLFLVTSAQDISHLGNWITEDARAQLQVTDFGSFFIVAVFQGEKLSNRYGVRIQRITREETLVTILVQFQEPKQGYEINPMVTSPYHLVRVKKAGDWNHFIQFRLVTDDRVILSTSYHTP